MANGTPVKAREPEAPLAVPLPRGLAEEVVFYTIEVAPCANGRFYVGVQAALCDRSGDQCAVELASQHNVPRDAVLGLVRRALAAHIETSGRMQ